MWQALVGKMSCLCGDGMPSHMEYGDIYLDREDKQIIRLQV